MNPEVYWIPEYGTCPKENISHSVIPNDQTSLSVENVKSLSDSGAIQRQGKGSYIGLKFTMSENPKVRVRL